MSNSFSAGKLSAGSEENMSSIVNVTQFDQKLMNHSDYHIEPPKKI